MERLERPEDLILEREITMFNGFRTEVLYTTPYSLNDEEREELAMAVEAFKHKGRCKAWIGGKQVELKFKFSTPLICCMVELGDVK